MIFKAANDDSDSMCGLFKAVAQNRNFKFFDRNSWALLCWFLSCIGANIRCRYHRHPLNKSRRRSTVDRRGCFVSRVAMLTVEAFDVGWARNANMTAEITAEMTAGLTNALIEGNSFPSRRIPSIAVE